MTKVDEVKFISLMRDATFKTLWTLGNEEVRIYFDRIIGTIIGIDIKNYSLSYNELGLNNYNSLANRVDILLISPDKKTKVNIELNKCYRKELINKNDSYILKLGGETYSGLTQKEKYKFNISVMQVNLNGFKSHYDTEFTINEYGIMNPKTGTERTYVKIFDISLPRNEEECYDIDNELRKDLMMFTVTDYVEMEKIAKGNKEREAVMKELERLGSDPKFVDYYDHEEFEEIMKEAIAQDAREEGHEKGIEEGKSKGIEQMIKSLYSNGMKAEDISKMSNIPLEYVQSVLSDKSTLKENN